MSRSWRTLAELRDNSCPAVDVCGQARATIHILPNMSTTLSTPAVESDPPIHDLSRAVHSLVHTSGGCARATYPHDLYTIHPTYPQSYPQEWGKVERSLCRPDECVQDTSRTHPIGSFAQSRHLSTLFGWLSTVEQWLSHPLARAANRPSQPLQPVRAGLWVSSTPLVDKSAERGQLAPRWASGRGPRAAINGRRTVTARERPHLAWRLPWDMRRLLHRQVQQPRGRRRRHDTQRDELGEGLGAHREVLRLLQAAERNGETRIEPAAHFARQEAGH